MAALFLNLAGGPSIEKGGEALVQFYQCVQKIKVHRDQGNKIVTQCADLLSALQENSAGMVGTDYIRAVDEVERAIERVVRKSRTWVSWGKAQSLLHQSEIKHGLEDLRIDLEHCARRFGMISHMETIENQRRIGEMISANHAEIQEKLERLLESTQDIQGVLRQPGPEIASHMLKIQEVIHAGVAQPDQSRSLQQRLYSIHRQTDLLPPMIDLTGEVRRLSEHPVNISGGYSDVYLGEWLGAEKVALKLTRGINQTPKAQKRFKNEVAIWRQLQHKNVARLYGIATIGDHIYTVSPWMENRDALTYVQSTPDVDRLKILIETATGMEFLHRHGVVHGDLRAANILISENGVAVITDFGLSVLLEEELDEATASTAGENHGNSRWMAPELINPELIGLTSVKPNPSTDVWSYGMFCLEILTGQRPFHDRPRIPTVIADLVNGVRPMRPPPEVTRRGLSDQLWELMQLCWHQVPKFRPTMSHILERMRVFQLTHSQCQSTTLPSPHSPQHPSSSWPSRTGERPSRESSPIPIPPPTRNILSAPLSYSPLSGTPPSATHGNFAGASSSSASSQVRPSSSTSAPAGLPTTRSLVVRPLQIQRSPSSPKIGRPRERSATLDVTNVQTSRVQPNHSPATGDDLLNLIDLVNHDWALDDRLPGLKLEQPSGAVSPTSPGASMSNLDDANNLSAVSSPSPRSSMTSEHRELLTPSSTEQYASGSSRSLDDVKESPQPRLNNAVTFGPDGRIILGALEGLVEQLLEDSTDFRRSMEYREIFLTSYQAFTNAEQLFSFLLQAYKRVSCPSHPSFERARVRHAVLTVLKTWLQGQHAQPKDRPLLERMRTFADEIQAADPGPTIATYAQQIYALIDSRMTDFEPPRRAASLASSTSSSVRPLEAASPRQIAEAITLMEMERFKNIIPSDCISYVKLKGAKDDNGVFRFIEENNKLSYWVQKSILMPNDISQRVANVKSFLQVAQECVELRNFSSACAIFAGVASQLITCLKRTATLDKSSAKISAMMETLMSSEGSSFRRYRMTLEGTKRPVLPWLRVHLQDLQILFDSRRRRGTNDNGDIINFDLYYGLYEMTRKLLNYAASSDSLSQIPRDAATKDVSLFIEKQLRTLNVETVRESLQRRSKKLEREEQADYHSHTQELLAAGFLRTSY